MARKTKSKMVSPEKTGGPQVDEVEESDEYFDAEDSHHDLTKASPDLPAPTDNIQYSAPVTNMGAGQSKQQMNAMIRAAAAELDSRATAAQTPATGKLHRVSKTASVNPPYRNPTGSVTSAQRHLPPPNKVRKSVYEQLDESPVKLNAPQAPWTEAKPQFSPRRAQRKKGRKGDNTEAEVYAAGDVDAERDAEDAVPKHNTRASRTAQNEAQVEVDVEKPDANYVDLFPDAVVHQYQPEQEANAGAADDGADEEAGGITVAEKPSGHDTATVGETAPKSKRGRPPKASTAAETSPKKGKPAGRPKKSADVVEQLPDRNRGSARLRQSTPAPAESAGSINHEDGPRRSTRQVHVHEEQVPNSSPRRSRGEARSTQPASKASRTASALAGVHLRRSQGDPDFQPENKDTDVAANVAEGEADSGLFVQDDESPHGPPASHQVDRVGPSELDFPEDEEDESTQPSSSSQKRKRATNSQAARPNTGRKRTRFHQSTSQDGQDTEAEGDARVTSTRLFGQWNRFKAVLRAEDLIGRPVTDGVPGDRNYIPLRDADVKATVKLCIKAIQRYAALKTHTGPVEPEQDPVNILIYISDRIDGLRGKNREFPRDLHDETKSTNIYSHLVGKLVKLVHASILCYEAMDAEATSEGPISMGHLKTVKDLIVLILELTASAQKYTRPPTDLHIVQPVRQLVPHLRHIHNAFVRELYNHNLSQETARREAQDVGDRIARDEEEVQRKRRQAAALRLRTKWQNLHNERMLAEGGLMRAAKRAHLQLPEQYHVEVDHNGVPFEREEIFHPRVGPPPDLVEAATMQQWSMVELSSLCGGLKDYTGEFVYERIMRRYCRPGGELNKYSVTEIVVTAAEMRERLIEDQKKNFGDVEAWIRDIPVWTHARNGVGQENEDAGGDGESGDVVMSGAFGA